MQLAPDQVDRFYRIWKPLVLFANRRLEVVPEMVRDEREPWDLQNVARIRDALWADRSVLDAFIAENPAGLSADDLALAQGWKDRLSGNFYVLRHLKKYSLFLQEKGSTVYGVLGLASPLEDVVPFVPCYVRATLLPFEGAIIYDSLLSTYNIHFGPGIRRSLEQKYRDAKERGAIVTSLAPAAGAAGQAEGTEQIASVNARVQEAFRAHLFRSGLSPKVVERDVANVSTFAEKVLLNLPEPRSLREFNEVPVRAYLAGLVAHPPGKKGQAGQAVLALKRFVKFLRDTERMDYDVADYILDVIAGKE